MVHLSGVLEPVRADYVHLFLAPCLVTMVGIFAPWKLENTRSQDFFFSESYFTSTSLDTLPKIFLVVDFSFLHLARVSHLYYSIRSL